MSSWDDELLFEANRPTHSFLNTSGKLLLIYGAQDPVEVEALAGRYNCFVPHTRRDMLDEALMYTSLGFCLVHDSYRPEWKREGAFGSGALPIRAATVAVDSPNAVLGIVDSNAVKTFEQASPRDRQAAFKYQIECFAQVASLVAAKSAKTPRDAYLHASQRLFAIPLNHGASGGAELEFLMMGATCVSIRCEWKMPARRVRSVRLYRFLLSDEMDDWVETGPGRALFPDAAEQVERALFVECAPPPKNSSKRPKPAGDRDNSFPEERAALAQSSLPASQEAGRATHAPLVPPSPAQAFAYYMCMLSMIASPAAKKQSPSIYDKFE